MKIKLTTMIIALAMMPGYSFATQQASKSATVELKNPNGQTVGKGTLTAVKDGVKLSLTTNGLTPGKHGIHFHQIGKCEGPDFKTAGEHFAPRSEQHGLKNPQGSHAGDLPNLVVAKDGSGKLETTSKLIRLEEAKNISIVIHEKADDQKTGPSGNSGGRIACGVIGETSG